MLLLTLPYPFASPQQRSDMDKIKMSGTRPLWLRVHLRDNKFYLIRERERERGKEGKEEESRGGCSS
jgi:hypothetical protein